MMAVTLDVQLEGTNVTSLSGSRYFPNSTVWGVSSSDFFVLLEGDTETGHRDDSLSSFVSWALCEWLKNPTAWQALKGEGGIWAREGERKGTPNPSPPPSRPNSLPLPFRTPATQAIQPPSRNFQVDGSFLSELSCTLISLWVFNTRKHTTNQERMI